MTNSLQHFFPRSFLWPDVKRMSFAIKESEPVLVRLNEVGRVKYPALFLPGEYLHSHIAERNRRKA